MAGEKKNLNTITLIILAAVVLSVGAAALLLGRDSRRAAAGREVRVYQNGRLCATGHLGQREDITVRGEDGAENVIAFTENGVYMKHSTCSNQLCVRQGMVTQDNFRTRFYRNQIICLPNRVTVEMTLTDAESSEIPDV